MKRFFSIAFFFSILVVQAQPLDTTAMSDDKRIAYRKVEGYRQRVIKGENMAVLASLYTEDPGSAKTGGAYYNMGRGQFVPEFENAAFKLKPGEVSEVFETAYGFHFVQLIALRGEAMDVRHILIKNK